MPTPRQQAQAAQQIKTIEQKLGPEIIGTPSIKPPAIFKDVADAVQQAVDFLKFIAWIFHPRNLLRAAEFTTGMMLMIFGIWAAIQSRGERAEGFATSEGALSRSGLGRVSRELAETRGRSVRPREAPHATKRKAVARGRHAAAHGKPRGEGTVKRIAKTGEGTVKRIAKTAAKAPK